MTGLVRRVGARNLAYVAALAALSVALRTPVPLVAGASFVHYGLYVVTFARRTAAWDEFVRDALFFKTVSTVMLGAIWLLGSPGLGSAALVVVGSGLSCWAVAVLGFERTWFGAELGRVPPARIDRPPYGWIPHPMILGAVVALIGVGLAPGVRAGWPWLVPIHVGLYLLHLAQEALDARR